MGSIWLRLTYIDSSWHGFTFMWVILFEPFWLNSWVDLGQLSQYGLTLSTYLTCFDLFWLVLTSFESDRFRLIVLYKTKMPTNKSEIHFKPWPREILPKQYNYLKLINYIISNNSNISFNANNFLIFIDQFNNLIRLLRSIRYPINLNNLVLVWLKFV